MNISSKTGLKLLSPKEGKEKEKRRLEAEEEKERQTEEREREEKNFGREYSMKRLQLESKPIIQAVVLCLLVQVRN